MRKSILLRTLPGAPSFLRKNITLSADNFGTHYVRWPYDPALNAGGAFTSSNPSRWQSEYDGAIGWVRAFDPNIGGRYQGGTFTQVGMTVEGAPVPYGRMEGGSWYQGMLQPNGSYNWSKMDLLVSSAAEKGVKVLLTPFGTSYYDTANNRYTEYPLPTGEFWSTNRTGYQSRLAAFVLALFTRYGNQIRAIEVSNEPGKLARLDVVGPPGNLEMLAVIARILKSTIRALGLNTLVVSPPFQGGEYAEVASFLNASAAGIAISGSDGTGTFGKDHVDVVAHHLYGNFSDRAGGGSTTAMDSSAYDSAAADAAYPGLTTFADIFAKGCAVVASAKGAGWTGEFWNTEFNLTGAVNTSLWYPRKMTVAGFARLTYLLMLAGFLSGFSKQILYAADHTALGTYDNSGTVPVGEPADWYFKAQDGAATRAAAVAVAIKALFGTFTGGVNTTDPFFSIDGAAIKVATTGSNGVLLSS